MTPDEERDWWMDFGGNILWGMTGFILGGMFGFVATFPVVFRILSD